jgi:hypothetical protein
MVKVPLINSLKISMNYSSINKDLIIIKGINLFYIFIPKEYILIQLT